MTHPVRRRHVAGIAIAFATAMAFSTAPTPLYPIYQERNGWDTLMVTIAFAGYALGVALSLWLAGHLSDRVGRRRLLLLGLAVELVSALLLASSDVFGVVLTARIIGGAGVGLLSATATAWIGELTGRTRLASRPLAGVVIATAANLLGFAVGPLLSGVIADVLPAPLHTPYLVFAGALVVALVVARRTPETVALPRTPAVYAPQRPRIPAASRAAYRSAALSTAAAFGVLGLFSSVAPGFVQVLSGDTSPTVAGLVAFTVFAASAVAQLALAGLPARVQWFGGSTALIVGLAVITVAAWLPDAMLLVAGGAIAGIGGGLVVRAALGTAMGAVAPRARGESIAGIFLAGYIGLGAPVVAVGVLVELTDPQTAVTALSAVTGAAIVVSVLNSLRPARSRVHGTPTFGEPGTRAYASATRRYDLAAPLDPARTVVVRTVGQARDAVEHARRAGLTVRMHSTGHGAGAARSAAGELLLSVQIDDPVAVAPDSATVRIPAGARWGAVVDALAGRGVSVPHGSSPDVGAVGYLLKGGMSFYGRSVGLAANSIVSIEVVLADGRALTTDAAHEPDLFWALRGGGGGLAVVTAVTIRTFPAAGAVTGSAFWPAEQASGLLEEWERWTRTAPREASTSFRIMNLPPLPGIPRALGGRTVVNVDGAILASSLADRDRAESMAASLLDPLRAIATPLLDSWRFGGIEEVPVTHMDPPVPIRHSGDHVLLGDLDEDGRSAYLDAAGATRGDRTLASVELRQLGGAFAIAPDRSGALGRLDASFALLAAGMHSRRTPRLDVERRLAEVRETLGPWNTGYTAPSFVSSPDAPQRSFDADTARRVDEIRRVVDPAGLFVRDTAPGAPACSAAEAAPAVRG
ncbi:MFS transporter [Herbiconiux sp. P17]|uniref:MFS transporter n=1 Tax=Herbiconiux wuyangfengii TaxID=3342794 RepID=UPI0035B71627